MESKSEIFAFLRGNGYEGYFLKKPDASRDDGPSTFYDKSRFALINQFNLPYCYKKEQNNKKGAQQLYEKGNCCLIMALMPLE